MKVLICGTFRSGKSTLVKMLQKERYPIISELAAPLIKKQEALGNTWYKASLQFQLDLLNRQLRAEKRMEEKHSVIICDRGVPDIRVYATLYGHRINFERKLKNHRDYNLVIMCDPEGIDVSDLTFEEQRKRDLVHSLYFDVFRNEYWRLNTVYGSSEERINQVKELFDDKGIHPEGQRRSLEKR